MNNTSAHSVRTVLSWMTRHGSPTWPGHRAKKLRAGGRLRATASRRWPSWSNKRPTSSDDMLMPRWTGWSWSRRFGAKYPLVPVIPHDGTRQQDIAIQALQKGAASYVPRRAGRDLTDRRAGHVRRPAVRSQQRIHDSLQSLESQFLWENDISLIPAAGQLPGRECGTRETV